MRKSDIAQVQAVEKQIFPTLFPPTSFRRELGNGGMRYWVAEKLDAPQSPDVPSSMSAGRSARGEMRRMLGRVTSAWSALRDDDGTQSSIVGFVGTWYAPGQAHIVSIGVCDRYRRRGIGEILLLAAVEHAMERQSDTITLEVRKSNASARLLYEKYGFVKRGIRRAYYSDNREDAIIMTTGSIQTAEYALRLAALKRAHRERWGRAAVAPDTEEGS